MASFGESTEVGGCRGKGMRKRDTQRINKAPERAIGQEGYAFTDLRQVSGASKLEDTLKQKW